MSKRIYVGNKIDVLTEMFKPIIAFVEELDRRVKKLEQNEPYPNKKELERMNIYEGSD